VQEEVGDEDEAYTEKVDMHRTIANTSSGPTDPQNNCVADQMGTKDVTKMLTVYKSPCQKGMINKTYHKEMKDVAHFTKEYRQMENNMRVEGSGKRHVDKDPMKRNKQTTHRKETEILN
jgi:hypothetical protein